MNYSDPTLHRRLTVILHRTYRYLLSATQFDTLVFIFDRTISWSKGEERIRLSHFDVGVWSKGICVAPPVKAGRRTIQRALLYLLKEGYISRSRRNSNEAFNYKILWPMKTPKRLKETEKGGTGGCHPCHPRVSPVSPHKDTTYKVEDNPSDLNTVKDSATPSPSSEDSKEDIEKGLEQTVVRSRSRRAAKESKGYYLQPASRKGFVPTCEAIRALWGSHHQSYFPKLRCAGLPDKSIYALRTYARSWAATTTTHEWTEFLQWVFENWNIIRNTSLKWMRDCPPTPEPFLVANSKMRKALEGAWQEREQLDELRKLTPRDREVAYLVSKGMDLEFAEKIATEIATLTEDRKALARERALLTIQKSQIRTYRVRKPRKNLSVGQNMTEEEAEEFERGLDKEGPSVVVSKPDENDDQKGDDGWE